MDQSLEIMPETVAAEKIVPQQQILGHILTGDYDQALVIAQNNRYAITDNIKLKFNGDSLVTHFLLKNCLTHLLTKLMVNAVDSYQMPVDSKNATLLLDWLILNSYEKLDYNRMMYASVRTSIMQPAYNYSLNLEARNSYNERGFGDKDIAELFAAHHHSFREYLHETPIEADKMRAAGVNMAFWLKKLTIDEIYDDVKKAQSHEQLTIKTSAKFQVHRPENVPTLDAYKQKNVLQPGVDSKLRSMIARSHFDRIAQHNGTSFGENTRRSLVFSGSPGVGKTTCARILGRYFRELGILSLGHVVETRATELIGAYVGQTAPNVKEAVTLAKGGILFIDEMYHVLGDGFGHDVVDELLAGMENNRNNLIVVIAGYQKENSDLLKMNSGLADRFGDQIIFEDFQPAEFKKILAMKLSGLKLSIDPHAENKFLDYIEKLKGFQKNNFANVRTLENLLEKVITCHAVQLDNKFNFESFEGNILTKEFLHLDVRDVESAIDLCESDRKTLKAKPGIGGFTSQAYQSAPFCQAPVKENIGNSLQNSEAAGQILELS